MTRRSIAFTSALVISALFSDLALSEERPGCRRSVAKGTVRDFTLAYSNGDQQLLNRTVASRASFDGYADGRAFAGLIPFTTSDREMLNDYFRMRHRFNDRLKLLRLRAAVNPRENLWNFQFYLHREADDILIPGGINQPGKGILDRECRISTRQAGAP